MDVWKVITADPNYEISNTGYVRRTIDKVILKGSYTQKGNYYRVHLNKFYRVHILVAIAFISNPDNLPDVHHKDNDTTNNHVDNLEWITNAENNKTENKTVRKVSSKFIDSEILYILQSKGSKSSPILAKELNKEPDAISKVWRGVNKKAAMIRESYLKTIPHNMNEFKF
jgi:hypothetical protein